MLCLVLQWEMKGSNQGLSEDSTMLRAESTFAAC
jgi:hypothetical protein